VLNPAAFDVMRQMAQASNAHSAGVSSDVTGAGASPLRLEPERLDPLLDVLEIERACARRDDAGVSVRRRTTRFRVARSDNNDGV